MLCHAARELRCEIWPLGGIQYDAGSTAESDVVLQPGDIGKSWALYGRYDGIDRVRGRNGEAGEVSVPGWSSIGGCCDRSTLWSGATGHSGNGCEDFDVDRESLALWRSKSYPNITVNFTQHVLTQDQLAVFGGFTLYDVQKILAHARMAERGHMKRDAVNESLSLELDFINIFIRMVQILAMQQGRKKR